MMKGCVPPIDRRVISPELWSNLMMMRSTSALNPVAEGLPVPASGRGLNDNSPKTLTRADRADTQCSTN